MGRQPWIVTPNPTGSPDLRMLTADGVSGNSAWMVATSLVVFTLVYGVLAVIWFGLMRRYAAAGAPEISHPGAEHALDGVDEPLSFAY